ncbi:hypothetical protein OJAV_G00195630 [Oryzias javanicus]|uniref:Uncharacterized protein n=1 Tax=Oryzias javanicus TaxID=123683 RepID=A0A3S2PDJ0_ORYJA|nr:hypothetical protein OJAV_G00195630 [Oryzias javanicus]
MAKAIGGFLRLLLLLFLAAKGCQSEDAHVGSAENYRDEAELDPRDELESDSYAPRDQTLWSPELFDWEDSELKTNDSLSSDNSTVDQHEEETLENNSSAQDLSNTVNYSEDEVEEFGCPSEQQPRSWPSHKEPQQSTCQSQESKKLGLPGQNDQSPERVSILAHPHIWVTGPTNTEVNSIMVKHITTANPKQGNGKAPHITPTNLKRSPSKPTHTTNPKWSLGRASGLIFHKESNTCRSPFSTGQSHTTASHPTSQN